MTNEDHLARIVAALAAYRTMVPNEIRAFIDAPAQESINAIKIAISSPKTDEG